MPRFDLAKFGGARENQAMSLKPILFLAPVIVGLSALLASSCAWLRSDTGQHVVTCGTAAVTENLPKIETAAVTCLVSANATACLLALVDPAQGITLDLIACLVRQQLNRTADRLTVDPVTAAQARANAQAFLRDQKILFAD